MFEEERIGEFLKQIKKHISQVEIALDSFMMVKSEGETKPYPEMGNDFAWEKAGNGTIWGGHNEYYVFKGDIEIPAEMTGKKVLFSLLTGKEGEWDATNPQFTVYVDGKLRQGFDVNHNTIVLSDNAFENERHSIFLSSFTGIQNYSLRFIPSLITKDEKISEYYYDLKIPFDTAKILEPSDENYRKIMPLLIKAVNMLDMRVPYSESFYKSIEESDRFLKECFYSVKRNDMPVVNCVGHTHIDIAWLWTTRVTRDKAVRSFSTALELMDRYPEYIFMSSQPQLYKYVKEDAPEVYKKIKERIKEGRWEAEGGMFLEPDCNLTSGESLIRQFLFGKKFFKDEFDVESRILWLPDVFGYSAALPQIMKKCGIDYFMTTKISWNEVNKMPYDTFYWKGIDGTKILSYFITTRDYVSKSRDTKTSNEFCTEISTNYNGYINPSEMMGAWQRYQQKDLSEHVLCSFGYGDGGGGATEEMIETGKRLEYGIPGCPATVNSKAIEFFDNLNEDISGKDVPIWSGELYLEYHRGTYTSMAENKRNNRKAEFALQNTESLGVLAGLFGCEYQKKSIDESWEKLLRNQFHDILPGSAVKEAYDDSRKEYADLFESLHSTCKEYVKTLEDNLDGVYIYNPNGLKISGIAESDNDSLKDICDQVSSKGTFLFKADDVPSKGIVRIQKKENQDDISISEKEIKTKYADIKFNDNGQIISWFDFENQREIIKPNQKANVLRAYDDRPHKFDNWNIFDYYSEIYWDIDDLKQAEVLENGPVRYALKFKWKYQSSDVSEIIYVYPDSKRIDFEFDADWNENQTLLKALFPIDINTDEATYDIQYGNVVRKTHKNTSWDSARFETCMHKWMDVSEGGFGISFLNDCKYGISAYENEIGITILKCGNYPNPEADRGHHNAVYSVYPHRGTWKEAKTVNEAYSLNNPLVVLTGMSDKNRLLMENGFISSPDENVSFDILKPSENGDGIIIRFHEFMNMRKNIVVRLARKAKEIWLCDMLENNEELLDSDTSEFKIEVKPYSINTLRLVF